MPPKDVDIEEDLAFLDWLGDNHFTFLGARDYALAAADGADMAASTRCPAADWARSPTKRRA